MSNVFGPGGLSWLGGIARRFLGYPQYTTGNTNDEQSAPGAQEASTSMVPPETRSPEPVIRDIKAARTSFQYTYAPGTPRIQNNLADSDKDTPTELITGTLRRRTNGSESTTGGFEERMMSGHERTRPHRHRLPRRRAALRQQDFPDFESEDERQRRDDDYWTPADVLGLDSLRPESYPPVSTTRYRRPSSSERSQNRTITSDRLLDRQHAIYERGLVRPARAIRPIRPITTESEPITDELKALDLRDDRDIPSKYIPSTVSLRKLKEQRLEKERKEAEAEKERVRKAKEADLAAKRDLRLNRRDPSRRLIQPLSSAWLLKIKHALDQARRADTPLCESVKRSPLHAKDFEKILGRGAWLNDEGINAYLEAIVDGANRAVEREAVLNGEPKPAVPRFFALNNMNFNQLMKDGPTKVAGPMRRGKVGGTSLLQVDTFFMPVNIGGNHWTLMAIRPVARTVEFIDSFFSDGRRYFPRIQELLKAQLGKLYIHDEWEYKSGEGICTAQVNGYDCGVFVCTNALCVALGLKTTCYKESDLLNQRQNIAAVLLNRGFTGDFDWASLGR